MKNIILSVVAIGSFGFAGGDIEPVKAESVLEEAVSPFYLGLGLSNVSTRGSSISLDFFKDKTAQDETGDILLMAGYDFNKYMAIEGRYTDSMVGEDLLTRESWGVYVKPKYPATQAFTLYALLGYGGLSVDGKGSNIADVDDTSFQWGVGASYALNAHLSIFFDYVNIANDMDADILVLDGLSFSGVDSDALSVGLTYSF